MTRKRAEVKLPVELDRLIHAYRLSDGAIAAEERDPPALGTCDPIDVLEDDPAREARALIAVFDLRDSLVRRLAEIDAAILRIPIDPMPPRRSR